MKTRIVLIEWDRDLLEQMQIGLVSRLGDKDYEIVAHRTIDGISANDNHMAVVVLGASTEDGTPGSARVVVRTLASLASRSNGAKVVLFTNYRLPRENLRVAEIVLKPSITNLAKAVLEQLAPASKTPDKAS